MCASMQQDLRGRCDTMCNKTDFYSRYFDRQQYTRARLGRKCILHTPSSSLLSPECIASSSCSMIMQPEERRGDQVDQRHHLPLVLPTNHRRLANGGHFCSSICTPPRRAACPWIFLLLRFLKTGQREAYSLPHSRRARRSR